MLVRDKANRRGAVLSARQAPESGGAGACQRF